MNFTEMKIKGAYLIEPEEQRDERGFFARIFCKKEFVQNGLETEFVQNNISYNKKKGTLRGMHYQIKPHQEIKTVSCIAGAIYDVILDLRKESATYGQWAAAELTAQNYRMLYIPKGLAHGFQTLEDDSTVFYQMGEYYHPECAQGIRWDDTRFNVQWPLEIRMISIKDKQ